MIVYLPVYDGGRKCEAIDTDKARMVGQCSILYHGRSYNGEHLYTTPEAVRAYWSKDYAAAERNRITWEEIAK